jgi:hypothetical protein
MLKESIRASFGLFLTMAAVCDAAEDQSRTIKFGMSTALSGPSQYLGLSIHKGMNTYFQEVNSGVNNDEIGLLGRQIELLVMDDFYDPIIAAENANKLIKDEKVAAIVGNVGTPTFERIWQTYYEANSEAELAEEQKIAIYGAFSGAALLRESDKSNYVFNYRASYDQEMSVIVKHIVQDSGISPNQIAFLLQGEEGQERNQPDSYGAAGLAAAAKALEVAPYYFSDSSSRLTQAIYIRNQLETKNAIEEILKLQRNQEAPQAIIIVGSYQASASFIEFMHRLLPTTQFYNLSFAGAGELARAMTDSNITDRVYMTQVVSMAEDEKMPADLVEREGYLAARELVRAIRNCFDQALYSEMNPASIKHALTSYFQYRESCKTSTPAPITDNTGNQLSNHVELSKLNNGVWVNAMQQVTTATKFEAP